MVNRCVILLLLLCITVVSYGQSKRKRQKSAKAPIEQPSALSPGEPQKVYAPKASRKQTKGATYNAEQEFYERMEELEKTKRKNEKLAAKPQYSDPMYFGHKKPPKKRKPGKMRFCKECGIRH
ncbi:MAG TPA: hypothetical protein VGD40_16815 [Chryseosolibacter sp.]